MKKLEKFIVVLLALVLPTAAPLPAYEAAAGVRTPGIMLIYG